jgi:hypothetical protein
MNAQPGRGGASQPSPHHYPTGHRRLGRLGRLGPLQSAGALLTVAALAMSLGPASPAWASGSRPSASSHASGPSAASAPSQASASSSQTASPSHSSSHSSPAKPASPASPPTTGTSELTPGFAGEVASASPATAVSITFTVPALSCATSNGWAAFTAAIYNQSEASQAGVQVTCTAGTVSYPVFVVAGGQAHSDGPVHAGDTVQARVTSTGSTCTASVDDLTTAVVYTNVQPCHAYTIASTGVVYGGTLPDFGVVELRDVTVDGLPLAVAGVSRRNGGTGAVVQATQGAYQAGGYRLTWVHA